MADLIAIGYKDEATAEAAADEARRRAKDLSIDQDAIAVIVRDSEGEFHVHTSHHSVEDGTTWGMLWGLLFGALFFVPFLGVAIGAGLGAIMGKVTKAGVNHDFQDQVRDLLKPGTSADRRGTCQAASRWLKPPGPAGSQDVRTTSALPAPPRAGRADVAV